MEELSRKLIKIIKDKNLNRYLMNCNFGLEKENVRVDENGAMALTPHPKVFGDRLKNPYIKTDFSESQVEMATPICHTIDETYDSLENIHDVVSLEIKNEYLWPGSNPPILPDEKDIPIAKMGDRYEEEFRVNLSKKYGSKKQTISGIHYNFSFSDEFLEKLYDEFKENESFREFKDEIYLKICRNFLKYRWFLIYMTGASPVFHESFIKDYVSKRYLFKDMISLRNSDYGYKNTENFYISFDSVHDYVYDIDKLVKSKKLQDICEFYGPARLKTGNDDNLSYELLEYGIKYIELRIFDLNPLFKIGISKDILYLTHLFVLYMLFMNDSIFKSDDGNIADKNSNLTCMYGRKNDLELYESPDKKILLKSKAEDILNGIKNMLEILNIHDEKFSSMIKKCEDKILNLKKTFAAQIADMIQKESYVGFHMNRAKNYLKESLKSGINLAACDYISKNG